MKFKYIYESRALTEYADAVLWYIDRSMSAAENFESAVNEKLDAICLHPKQYHIAKKVFREAILHKFPYSIIYFIEEEISQIVIISIFHNSRNPRSKFTRF